MRVALGGGLVGAAVLLLSTRAPAQQAGTDPAKIEEAKKHMEAGAAFYNDPSGHKCEEAYKEFKKAHELSGSLNALKGMAVCALELERDGEAIEHYERFLELKGDKIDAADKAQAEADLKALGAAIAWVTVKTDRPSVRISDVRTPSKGYPITNRYAVSSPGKKLGIHPGEHVITASADGAPDQVWKVDVANGGAYEHAFDFGKGKTGNGAGNAEGEPGESTDTPPAARPTPASVFVFAGITAALAIPTVVLMVRAKGLNDDYDAQNGTLARAELEDQRSSVQSANLVADIFLGATAVGLVTTAVLYFTRPAASAPELPAAAARCRWIASPALTPAGAGAVVRGSF